MPDAAIREAIARHRGNVTAAASELGVNRSTLHRWLKSDPSLAPQPACVEAVTAAAQELGPEDWARSIERAYDLTATERVLLDLARQALQLAHDNERKPTERLSAMGRFQQLVTQMKLEAPSNGQTQETARLYRVK